MRGLAALLAVAACTKAQQPHPPPAVATPDATITSEPATLEQCELVLDHFADLEIAREPEGDTDATAAKKAFIIARSRKQGFVKLCLLGTRAMADCLIRATETDAQTRCTLDMP